VIDRHDITAKHMKFKVPKSESFVFFVPSWRVL